MQYVRSIGGSVSKTWNSINPATLSGAIDVIVVELEDGESLHGSCVLTVLLTPGYSRLARLLPVSRSIREILLTSAI